MSQLVIARRLPEPEHLVNFLEYHKTRSQKPRNFEQFCDMVSASKDTRYAGKIKGIWEWRQWDPKTGETRKREWNMNVVTDDGAIEILKCAINNAVPAAVFNNIYINNNSGSTTLTTALTNGQTAVVSLAVAALPAAIPLNNITPATGVTNILVGYGTAQTQQVVMNAAAVLGAVALTTVSYTSNAAYAIGSPVVPVPVVSENPTNTNLKVNQTGTVVESNSGALSAGAYTFTATTGAGNRNVVVTFTFKTAANGGSATIGNYTDAWLCNVLSAPTTNNYICHEVNTPMRCDNSNNVTVTITIKI